MKYCADCGAENVDTALCCAKCGVECEVVPLPETHYIKFYCTRCRQPIEAPTDMAGNGVDCPRCGVPLDIPDVWHTMAGGSTVAVPAADGNTLLQRSRTRTDFKRWALFMMVVVVVAAGLWLAGGTGGCSREAREPKDAVINMIKAFQNGDKRLFLSAVAVDEQDQDAAAQYFDTGLAAFNFVKSMEKAYGDAATEILGKSADAWPSLEQVRNGMVGGKGDHAVVVPAGGHARIRVVRADGIWKVKMGEGQIVTGAKKAQDIQHAQAAIKGYDSVMGDIGKPGMTVATIMQRMQDTVSKEERKHGR